ncbi:MAG: hypothetical protein M3Y07_03845 [Acidobacteriota bacterium]|nr:hypothetical protein [Acidobacteriota bacterium]
MHPRFAIVVVAVFLLAFVAVFAVARPNRAAPQATASAGLSSKDDSISFLVTFGYRREGPKVYDGSIGVTGGRLRNLDSWRFFQQDAISGGNSWKLQIKEAVFENQPDHPNPVAGGSLPARNLVTAGVIATVDAAASSAEIETRQGGFSVAIRQLAYGAVLRFLDGDVLVQRVPGPSQVSPLNSEQHDYPSIAVARNGTVWTAWQAYHDRGDIIYARAAGREPMRVTDEKADIYRTSIAEDRDGRIHVAWSEHVSEDQGRDWFLFERVYDGKVWTPRRQIALGHSPNIFHKLVASSNGPLRLVWVGHDGGQSYLYVNSWDGSRWSEPQRMSDASVWNPDAVSDAEGNLLIAWDSYQSGNYDIFFRRIKRDGTPEAIERITTSPRFQAHASLTVDGQGRPWLAWDESGSNWGKDWTHEDPFRSTVLYANRSIRVAVKDAGTWKEAPDFAAAVPDRLKRYWQLPRLAADSTGRVWAMFQMRSSAVNNRDDYWCSGAFWDLYLTTLENGAWKPAAMIPQSSGRNEAAFQMTPAGNRVVFAWSMDGRQFGNVNGGFEGGTPLRYNIFESSATSSTPAGTAALTAFSERGPNPQLVHMNEKEDVARIRGYRASVNGSQYRIMRGDFHRHTEISGDGGGDGSVEDYYRYMIDVASMDTGIIGDHNMGGDVEYSWWRTEKSYDVFHIASRFTPLFGYERSVAYPNGHRNIVMAQRGARTLPVTAAENQAKINSGPVLYPYLRQNRGICMEHSLATGQGTDYRDNDPELEPLVELYQGYHAAYEYEGGPRAETATNHVLIHGSYQPAGFWWNALAKGLKLGVQSSSDHISTHCSYAMIYTPSDDRTQIVESMRQRHAYAATDNIVLDFEAEEPNGKRHLMGDAFVSSGVPKLTAKIEGTDRIKQIDLIRNNEFLYTQKPDSKNVDFGYVDQSPKAGESYYYLRVMQLDGNLAWSSPIWIKR